MNTDTYGRTVCPVCGGVGYESCVCPPAIDDYAHLVNRRTFANGTVVGYLDPAINWAPGHDLERAIVVSSPFAEGDIVHIRSGRTPWRVEEACDGGSALRLVSQRSGRWVFVQGLDFGDLRKAVAN